PPDQPSTGTFGGGSGGCAAGDRQRSGGDLFRTERTARVRPVHHSMRGCGHAPHASGTEYYMKESSFTRVALLALTGAAVVAGPLSAQPGPSARGELGLGIDTTNFDHGVRPQDDFFRFTNGTWLNETQIPEDRSSYGSFVELADASQ